MSNVQSPKSKVKKNLKIIAKIFAQFNYFLYLCNVVERQQKKSVQAIEKFLVGLPENFRWLHPLKHD